MKKFTAYILLILLFFTVLGYHFVFRYQVGLAKQQMKEHLRANLSHQDLITIRLSPDMLDSLEWENDHEFGFRGQMYDLVDRSMDGRKLVFRCVADQHETALVQKWLKATGEKGSENGALISLLQLASLQYVLPLQELPGCPQQSLLSNYPLYQVSLLQVILGRQAPPPRLC